jgi:hypothetical protein
MYTSRTVSELSDRLLEDAAETEALRDRYTYRGNAKYPRQFPGEAYARLDRKAQNLREAAAVVLHYAS